MFSGLPGGEHRLWPVPRQPFRTTHSNGRRLFVVSSCFRVCLRNEDVKPADWIGRWESAKVSLVGTAGRMGREDASRNPAGGNRVRKDLISWKRRRESPEGPVKRPRRKLPFLENSTACQKSTPDMLIPRPPLGDVVPL